MKYQDNNSKAKIAVISGIAIGLSLGLLIVYQNRKKIKSFLANNPLMINYKKKKAKKAQDTLSQVIEDVRSHVEKNAAGLLG